jgi:hypothetical protein
MGAAWVINLAVAEWIIRRTPRTVRDDSRSRLPSGAMAFRL